METLTTNKTKTIQDQMLHNFNVAFTNYTKKRDIFKSEEEFGIRIQEPQYSDNAYNELRIAEKQLSEAVFSCMINKVSISF